jgi:hypothetical protein
MPAAGRGGGGMADPVPGPSPGVGEEVPAVDRHITALCHAQKPGTKLPEPEARANCAEQSFWSASSDGRHRSDRAGGYLIEGAPLRTITMRDRRWAKGWFQIVEYGVLSIASLPDARRTPNVRCHVRGHSVETELVALDVLHHEARLVVVIGRQ